MLLRTVEGYLAVGSFSAGQKFLNEVKGDKYGRDVINSEVLYGL